MPYLLGSLSTALVAVILSLPTAALEAEEPPGPVRRLEAIDQAIAHHGGELYRQSETELDVCSRSGCYDVLARIRGDAFAYEVSGAASGAERHVRWTSDELTLSVNGVPTPIAPAEEKRLCDWVMARVYFPFLPYRLNDPSVLKQDLGFEKWNGNRLRKVKVTFESGTSTDANDEYLYWLDPESGRVEQFAYSYEVNGGGLRLRQATDFRRVGGLLFSDQINLGIDGAGLSVDLITPSYVKEKMRHISTVRLKNVEVRLFE